MFEFLTSVQAYYFTEFLAVKISTEIVWKEEDTCILNTLSYTSLFFLYYYSIHHYRHVAQASPATHNSRAYFPAIHNFEVSLLIGYK